MHTCAWCHKRIKRGHEVFGVGAKTKPNIDLTDSEGTIITLVLAKTDKNVFAMVPTSDSPAKKHGNDLYFMVCSQDCGQDLMTALRMEISTIDQINRA